MQNLKMFGFGVLSVLLTFGASWVNQAVTPFSFVWALSALVIVGAGIAAIYFLLIAAALSLVVVVIFAFFGWVVTNPW